MPSLREMAKKAKDEEVKKSKKAKDEDEEVEEDDETEDEDAERAVAAGDKLPG